MFGRFPGYLELAHIPQGEIPKFIKTNIISPPALYEKFNSGDCCGLACPQFLAAFNLYLGDDSVTSKNAMSEFFHNLSTQVLSKSNDTVIIKFEAITELIKSINSLLQKKYLISKK